MSSISSKGGKFKGNSHADGGIPLVVKGTGQQIEVEGEEALIPEEVSQDPNVYKMKGTNAEILDKVLDKVGAKGIDEKATEVHAGDMITCVRSTNDEEEHAYEGTLKQIVSKVNESGGCNPIHEGGEQVYEDGGSTKKKLLKGGKIATKKKGGFVYSEIDDSLYTWQYGKIALYSLYAGEETCELDCLINHPKLFKKYKGIGKVKVRFFNGEHNGAETIIPKTADVVNNFSECTINITLNFDYYEETGNEFKTIDSDEPDLARESILLHEIQHLLQSSHNRPCGTSLFEASKKGYARLATLRASEEAKRLTEKESTELNFYNKLTDRLLCDYFYFSDDGEIEARATVINWLESKGIVYIDPLTEYFGIEPNEKGEFKDLYEGGGSIKTSYKSNLTPEQQKLVRTPEFKAWFGDWENDPQNASKIVDENGEPQIVYHGTDKEFSVFDTDESVGSSSGNYGHYGYGSYFSFDKNESTYYGSNVSELFIRMINPFIPSADNIYLLKENGIYWIDEHIVLSIDYTTLHKELKNKDSVAAYLLESMYKLGFEKGWDEFNSKYKAEDSKIDVNSITDVMSYVLDINGNVERIGVPDYIYETITDEFGIDISKIKFNKGFDYTPSFEYAVTLLGERSKEVTDVIKKLNFDGIIVGSELIAFEPTQIKLADGSNKKFDLNNPDIRYVNGGGIPERYKDLGFTKTGQKKKSTLAEKKWMVLAKKGDKYKVVHGGHKGMQDFTQHKDEERRKRFWNRMGGIDSEKARDQFSPLYWHKKFGTWENGGVLPDDTIKVVWVDSDTPDTMESKMFEDIVQAKKYANQTGDKFLIMELEQQNENNGYYKWTLLPYGEYKKYKTAVNIASIFKNGGQLEKGIAVEMEHKDSVEKLSTGKYTPKEGAEMIAKDHLKESPDYYDLLESMESKFEEGGKTKSINYPLASIDLWYGDSDYKARGGKMIKMSPEKYLSLVRPLDIDDASRDNIDDLKRHIQSGKQLDPLAIYKSGKEDGRHRAYASKELGIKEVPVIIFRNGGIIDSENALDKILEEAEPFIDSVYEKRIELIEKENEERGYRPLSNYDKQAIRFGLILDLVKAVGNYIYKTDEISNLRTDKTRGGVISISANVKRDDKDYYFSTQMIIAGGHNVQVRHYRYIVDTTLPRKSLNTDAENLKKEIKKLSKKDKIQKHIDTISLLLSTAIDKRAINSKLSDKDIYEILTEGQKRIINTKWSDLSESAKSNFSNNESQFNEVQKDYLNSCIRSWRAINIPSEDHIKHLEKTVSKNKKNLLDVDKFQEGGDVDSDMDNFDWNSMFNEPSESSSEKELEIKKNQKPIYSIEKIDLALDSKIKLEQDIIDDWSSRVYKSNKGIVYAGDDDIHGQALSIGGINEAKRYKKIKSAQETILSLNKAKEILTHYKENQSNLYEVVLDDFRTNYYRGYKQRSHKRDFKEESKFESGYDILINTIKEVGVENPLSQFKEDEELILNIKKSKIDWLEYKASFYGDSTYIMQNSSRYPDDADYDKLFELSKYLVDSGKESDAKVANEWAEQFVIHLYYDPTFEGLRKSIEIDKADGTKLANDWIEFGFELPSDILVSIGLYKPSNFRPIFWQMTMDEFCDYAENYEVDTRLDGTKARLECKDFYKYSVILPMLHESAERNVFLLAVETNQLPYDKAVEIIKSANGWNENNKFIEQLLEYNQIRNFNANIWKQPKDIYLSSEYFKNNFTKPQANKWYAKQIYKDAILDDKELHSFLEKGIVKFKDVEQRISESGANITKADQRFIDKLKNVANKFQFKLKLKGLRIMIDDELSINKEVESIEYHKELTEKGNYLYGATVTFNQESVFIPLGGFGEDEIKQKAEKVLSELKNGSYKDGITFKEMAGRKNLNAIERNIKNEFKSEQKINPTDVIPDNQIKFVERLSRDTHNGVKYNKTLLEKTAREFGINEQNLAKELAELSMVILARYYAHDTTLTKKQRYDKIVNLYENQVSMSHRTSESILLQQYSTPVAIGYLMGLYCGVDWQGGEYFEPSAGNSSLTIAGDVKDFTVNEIDDIRNRNLKYLGFKKVLKQDASEPFIEFDKKFDAVITNPPFGKTDPVKYGKVSIGSLEQLMALRALDTMKDNGRSAIILGGHTIYDKEGRIQKGKNREFFVYLYKHYNVIDVINISGRDLYSRQGTAFNTRIVLIEGRKTEPSGFPPIIESPIPMYETNSYTPVDSFEVLWQRISKHF